jgi:ubiquinone/menaquinone biosynthesis C-methylase UbiE
MGKTAVTLLDAGFDVVASDIAANCLNDDIKAKLDNRFVTAPAWNLPFDDDEFDAIFCCDVLEHILRELVDVRFVEMGRVSPWVYAEIASFDRKVSYNEKPLHVHLTVEPMDYWTTRMERAGYEILIAEDRKKHKVHKTNGYAIWARQSRLETAA